jgi:hypothetical protein
MMFFDVYVACSSPGCVEPATKFAQTDVLEHAASEIYDLDDHQQVFTGR